MEDAQKLAHVLTCDESNPLFHIEFRMNLHIRNARSQGNEWQVLADLDGVHALDEPKARWSPHPHRFDRAEMYSAPVMQPTFNWLWARRV